MLDRRDFLRHGALIGGAIAATPFLRLSDSWGATNRADSLVDHPASECPIDTVVIVLLENRSFDHMLGWLARDEQYLETGRSRFGRSFRVAASTDETYRGSDGDDLRTFALATSKEPDPWRGCGHPIPGHGWNASRVQLQDGFVAKGTGNDSFALGYFRREDLPVYAALATNYGVHDRHFASLLGETLPNRQYAHSATSNGEKDNPGPLKVGMFPQTTIWDRLERAGVEARYYYADFPYLLGFGERMSSRIWSLDRYFEECATGQLPHYSFVCPTFGGTNPTDGHPRGDINTAQRYVLSVFRAFAESPQWDRGMFLLAHDEWGGFFDHVEPPRFPDRRASSNLNEDFGQLGFRVPSVLASPWVAPGSVHHAPIDHTAMLRFLEWRFLGAPARGRTGRNQWWLTERDRAAHNLGAALTLEQPRPDLAFDLDIPIPRPTPVCGDEAQLRVADGPVPMTASDQLAERIARDHPPATTAPWLPPAETIDDPTSTKPSHS